MRIYRASELGGCLKYQVAKQLGYELMDPPKEFAELFKRGEDAENEVISELCAGGEFVLDRQKEVNLVINDDCMVQGHIDGVMDQDERILEIKSMGQAQWDEWKKFRWDTPGLVQRYKWQLSSYMLALEAEALVVIRNRDTGEIHREGVELPLISLDQIRERVLVCESWVVKGEMPTKCDIVNYPCPVFYLHEESEEDEVDEDLAAAAVSYSSLVQQEREVKALVQRQRDKLLEVLGARVKYASGGVRVSYSDVKSKRFNADKARKDGVEVDKYMDDAVHKRLTVKVEDDADTGTGEGD